MAVPKVKFWRSPDGLWRFGLSAGNGESLDASQGYKTRAGCLRGIAAAKRNWRLAEPVEVVCAPSR